MILLLFIILAISFFIYIFLFKNFNKNILVNVSFFLVIVLAPIYIYIYNSNYWIGQNVLEKFQNKLNIEVASKISPKAIYQIIDSLEARLNKNPKNIDIIKKLGQAKYLVSDYKGALALYELGRTINNNDIELLLGEANIRLFMEKDNLSRKTINLFKEIYIQDPNNLLGLLVLGDHAYDTKNILNARKYYDKLLGLLDKNSLEYKQIYQKLENMNEK